MSNWNLVAVSAAAASAGMRNSAGTPTPAPRWIFSRARSPAAGASASGRALTPARFDDARSRKQITVYLSYRSRASDERNEQALAHWNANLRQQWEIDHLEPGRPHTDVGSGRMRANVPATISRPA